MPHFCHLFLKVMAAAQLGDHDTLAAGLSPVESLPITAAERHVRADLEVVDAAEATLRPDVLIALARGQDANQVPTQTEELPTVSRLRAGNA